MKVLIVGGTSMLGNALKPVLSGIAEVITAGRKNCDVQFDLKDPLESIHLPLGFDVVIHTAAHFGGKEDNDIVDAEDINVIGTLKLCHAAARSKAGHFVFISSVFSALPAYAPGYTIYALSKRHAEEALTFYCQRQGLPLSILRPSQVYGNNDGFRRHQPFFYMMMDKAEKGEDITLYGNNDPKRNYIHIDDLTGIINVVVQNGIEGVYGCANPADVTYSQIAEAAYSAFGKGGGLSFLRDKPDIPDNIFDKDNSLYDKTGIYPKVTIEEGINRLANYRRLQK